MHAVYLCLALSRVELGVTIFNRFSDVTASCGAMLDDTLHLVWLIGDVHNMSIEMHCGTSGRYLLEKKALP
jgi:hypothetical protein